MNQKLIVLAYETRYFGILCYETNLQMYGEELKFFYKDSIKDFLEHFSN